LQNRFLYTRRLADKHNFAYNRSSRHRFRLHQRTRATRVKSVKMSCERIQVYRCVPILLDLSSRALATEDARGSACAFSVALPNMKIHLNKEKLAWN
jgi:hypothetical protein